MLALPRNGRVAAIKMAQEHCKKETAETIARILEAGASATAVLDVRCTPRPVSGTGKPGVRNLGNPTGRFVDHAQEISPLANAGDELAQLLELGFHGMLRVGD